MDDRTHSGGGASALVAATALAAALIAVSCAERSVPSGPIGDGNGRAVAPATPEPHAGVGGPITLEEPDVDYEVTVDAAGFAGAQLMMEVGGVDARAPGLLLLDAEAPAEDGAGLALLDASARALAGGEGTRASGGAPGLTLADTDAAGEVAKKAKDARARPVRTWKRVEATPNTSRLLVGDKEELELKGLQANVRIDGFRARVVLDLFYFNDRDRQFEGTFKLRLPNEASPFMFAFGESVLVAGNEPDEPRFILDDAGLEVLSIDEIIKSRAETWENVKEARMVPREKAAFAYTETVRRRIDPALLEWSGAGVFSARVFPLSPKKLHRIVIGYDVDLLQVGDDLVYRFDLPSGVKRRVVDIDLAELRGVTVEVTGESKGVKASGRIHYRFGNPDVKTITVRQKSPGTMTLSGESGFQYVNLFATRFRPDLPKAAATGGSSHAVFLVDVSLSSNPERFNVWLKLMRAILDGNRDTMKHFAVMFFNVESFWWRESFASNTPENVEALMAFAEALVLEGATDLSAALAEAAVPEWYVKQVVLGKSIRTPLWDAFLLSDGAATWGEGDLHALASTVKRKRQTIGPNLAAVFAYTTGFAGTDTRALQHVARETGGAVFSVTGEAEVAAASRAHRSRPWRIVGIRRFGGDKDFMLAGRPATVFPGQTLLLTGRDLDVPRPPTYGSGIRGEILLERDGKTKAIQVHTGRFVKSDLAPRIYGQVATGQLEEFHKLDEATEDVAAAYARHFRVTGQTCSLLMLESEDDYKRYNISPEEDAFVVKSTLASEFVAKAIAAIGDSLADGKKRFMAWVRKLERAPGFELKLPTALKLALERMPRASFEVAPKPLRCRLRRWEMVPGNIQEMLVSKKLDYDAISKEAQRRFGANKLGEGDALKALSSLIENSPGDGVLARDVAFSAMEWGLGSQAYYLLRRVATSRPWEPQTYHALAQVLAGMGKIDLAICYYELALAGKWHTRFGEFRKIAALDYMRFLKSIVEDPAARPPLTTVPDFAAARLETVAKEVGLEGADLMVTITWNTDSTDIDLHVKEPGGEECYYEHTKTKSGGEITEDVTQGYGPEMYVLKEAPRGQYHVRVKFYSSDRNRASARTKVYATVYRDWNRPTETVTRKVVTLVDGKEFQDVGRFVVKK
jgi:hypothetical protein